MSVTVRSYLDAGDDSSLADDVFDGLTRLFEELPPKYFYDQVDASCSTASASCPSITPRAPSDRF